MDKRENCLKLCLALRLLLVLLLMGNAESRVAVSVLVVVLGLPCIRSPEDYSEPTGSDRFRRQFLSCVWVLLYFSPHLSLVHSRFRRAEPVLWRGGKKVLSLWYWCLALLCRYFLN